MTQCEICKGNLNDKDPANSRITLEDPDTTSEWTVCDICASAVREFIMEFKDDIETGFKDQDESWKLRKDPSKQKILEVFL